MKFIIPGRPIPAVRMTQKTKWKKSSKKYLAYKEEIGNIAKKVFDSPTSEKVRVRVVVRLAGKTTEMGRDGDVDNYLKSALDGLNKIAFVDDRQVIGAIVDKFPCKSEEDQCMEIYLSVVEGG